MSPPARAVPAVALWLGGPPVAAVAAVVLLDPGVELVAVVLPTAQPRLAVRVTVAVALRHDQLSHHNGRQSVLQPGRVHIATRPPPDRRSSYR